tara:strand:- start:293 stop:829 length:537 start_codon:yes stop_codon:yes gene_type:complete
MIDMEKDTPIPKQEDLHGIAMLAAEQVKITKELADLENQLNTKKAELFQITEVALPESMLQLGLQSFTLDDGTKLAIKTFYRGSIPKGREIDAFAWLDDHGHADLIKNEVKSTFGKGEDDEAQFLMTILDKHNLDYENKKAVHPSTLKAFVREQIESGKELPLDLLGVHIGQRSEIRR